MDKATVMEGQAAAEGPAAREEVEEEEEQPSIIDWKGLWKPMSLRVPTAQRAWENRPLIRFRPPLQMLSITQPGFELHSCRLHPSGSVRPFGQRMNFLFRSLINRHGAHE